MRLIDTDKLSEHKFTRESAKGSDYMRGWNDAIDAIVDNEPTVEYPDQVTIKCGTEEDKQKLLSALRNVKLKAVVEDERQGEWILISERLPDYMDDILVTFQKPNREPILYRAVFIGSKFALDNGDVWNWNDPEVKAWMPLPEAYKEAEND